MLMSYKPRALSIVDNFAYITWEDCGKLAVQVLDDVVIVGDHALANAGGSSDYGTSFGSGSRLWAPT